MEAESRHQCLLYDGPPSHQLPALAAVIQRKLNDGHRCLYLNSPAMIVALTSCLAATGLNVEHEISNARLVLSSENVATTDGFDAHAMLLKLEALLDNALSDGHTGLWATGDMTWEFGAEKNFSKLMDYEYRLEELMRKRPQLSGICQYHQDTLPRELAEQALLTHPALFINETLSRINSKYVPSGSSKNS